MFCDRASDLRNRIVNLLIDIQAIIFIYYIVLVYYHILININILRYIYATLQELISDL